MLRFLADENFSMIIVDALRERLPSIDIRTIAEAGLRSTDDPAILEFAAKEQRLVLTHDIRTMTAFAVDRVRQGLPMPGLIEVRFTTRIADVLDELTLLAQCSHDGEWNDQILFIPML